MKFLVFLIQYVLSQPDAYLPAFDAPLDLKTALGEEKVVDTTKYWRYFDRKSKKIQEIPFDCAIPDSLEIRMWGPNELYRDHQFAYNCSTRQSDGAMGVETIGCIHDIMDRIEIGDTLKLNNGSVLVHCEQFQGRVRKVSEAVTGCFFNGTVYREGQRWTEPNEHPSVKYVQFECSRSNSSGYFEKKTAGCVVEYQQESSITYVDSSGQGNDTTISWLETFQTAYPLGNMCVETSPGKVKVLPFEEVRDLPCTFDGVQYANNEFWNDEKRGARMHCDMGIPWKSGCMIKGKYYHLTGRYRLDNGCEFYCHSQTNLYFCDNRLEVLEKTDKS